MYKKKCFARILFVPAMMAVGLPFVAIVSVVF